MAYVERFICTYSEERTDEKNRTYTWKCDSKAKDAHDDIAVEEIVSGCETLASYASSLKDIGKNIESYGDLITKNDLSVDGTGVDGLVTNFSGEANKLIGTNIVEHVNGVKANAISVFNELQTTYNEIAKANCSHN